MKHIHLLLNSFSVVFVAIIFVACNSSGNKTATGSDGDTTTVAVAKEAFIYGVPVILMDLTRKIELNGKHENQFEHRHAFPDASFKNVVRPNADTYYSTAYIDLSGEPLVLSVPNTNGRYYMLPMMDAYSNVFFSPGKRTTGTQAKTFLLTGPFWKGTVPAKMQQIAAPTNLVWMIGRTQVNSKEDGEQVVRKIQDGYKLTPLSIYEENGAAENIPEDTATQSSSGAAENPNVTVGNMPIDSFFNYLNRLMVNNPPASADKAALEKFATIGVAPGKTFTLSQFNAATQTEMKKIPQFVMSNVNALEPTKEKRNGWRMRTKDIGSYGTNYTARAFTAIIGLGANIPEDAIYPTCEIDETGAPLDGSNKYVLHFDKSEIPAVKGFWSITLYDKDGFFTDNSINRYAIGDRDKLKYNNDGSLDVYIQHNSPGKDKEGNWLPAPSGIFNLTMRLYWPEESVLSENWNPPVVKKI